MQYPMNCTLDPKVAQTHRVRAASGLNAVLYRAYELTNSAFALEHISSLLKE